MAFCHFQKTEGVMQILKKKEREKLSSLPDSLLHECGGGGGGGGQALKSHFNHSSVSALATLRRKAENIKLKNPDAIQAFSYSASRASAVTPPTTTHPPRVPSEAHLVR